MDEICHRLERIGFSSDGLCEKEFASDLQKLCEMLMESKNRSKLPDTAMTTLCHILGRCVTPQEGTGEVLTNTQQDQELRTVCCWCLRCLRNACVQSPSNQRLIRDAGAVDSIKKLISLVSAPPSPTATKDELALPLRCAVQLLGNLISGQPGFQALLWKEIFPHSLHSVFEYNDPKASQYLCMVINMCIQDSSSTVHACKLWTCDDGYQLVEAIFALCQTESEHDFGLELMRTLIGIPDFIPAVFNHLSVTSRIILLDILAALLSDQDTCSSSKTFPERAARLDREEGMEDVELPSLSFVDLFAKVFEKEAESIFGLVSEEEWSLIEKDKKPQLVTRLLNILCIASTNHRLRSMLQERVSLLECGLSLLDRANNAGKKGRNLFTPTHTQRSAEAETNPVFGFKRDLVRLIGNMCHNHTANQNKLTPNGLRSLLISDGSLSRALVRDLHGIPAILEQCNIDDSNPFISQWAILAIRNLCDGNSFNQAVIADMTNQGVINNDQLQQYGFQAEWRDGRIYYRSTKKK